MARFCMGMKNTKLQRVRKGQASDRSLKKVAWKEHSKFHRSKTYSVSDSPRTDRAQPKPKQEARSWFPVRNDDNQVCTYMETCDMEFSRLHGVHPCRAAEEALCFQAWQMVDQCSAANCSLWPRCQEHEELHLAF